MTKKHALIMVACCLIPIAGFALASLFNIPIKSVLLYGMIIACPLSHLLMMKFMMHGDSQAHHHETLPQVKTPTRSAKILE
jgi:hypothetical protein